MVNITHKSFSLRKAIATAIVKVSRIETIEAVRNRTVPKGDVLEFARAAGLLGIKKTSDVIPDCHPLPVEFAAITYELGELDIKIMVEVHTLYKTGVEVEAMHGASVAALVIYDMLKPIDKHVEIGSIRLEHKSGGKSDLKMLPPPDLKCAVIVCSDRISKGEGVDTSGQIIIQKLETLGYTCQEYLVIPDDFDTIQYKAKTLAERGFQFIIFCGGTGVAPRDMTPDAISPLLTTILPGIMETARAYGQQRTSQSMLSRGIAGFINQTFIITVPGSTNAAREYMDALFPGLLHLFPIKNGASH
jgi:cyclic pyranopterin phosphate synthase